MQVSLDACIRCFYWHLCGHNKSLFQCFLNSERYRERMEFDEGIGCWHVSHALQPVVEHLQPASVRGQ